MIEWMMMMMTVVIDTAIGQLLLTLIIRYFISDIDLFFKNQCIDMGTVASNMSREQ